jgi:surface antigen
MGHALELAGERATVAWTSGTGARYELTPTRNVGDKANPCREFVTRVSNGKVSDAVKGVACRRGTGEWVFKS